MRRIDINTADETTLMLLPGIGPVRARAIADTRDKSGPFRDVDELQRAPRIPRAVIEKLRAFAACSRPGDVRVTGDASEGDR